MHALLTDLQQRNRKAKFAESPWKAAIVVEFNERGSLR